MKGYKFMHEEVISSMSSKMHSQGVESTPYLRNSYVFKWFAIRISNVSNMRIMSVLPYFLQFIIKIY